MIHHRDGFNARRNPDHGGIGIAQCVQLFEHLVFTETVHRNVGTDIGKEDFPEGAVVHLREGAGNDEKPADFAMLPAGIVHIGSPPLIRCQIAMSLELLNRAFHRIARAVVFFAELVAGKNPVSVPEPAETDFRENHILEHSGLVHGVLPVFFRYVKKTR